ncbi:MAG: DnaJ domain-containing protein [Ruminococcus sp.]|nr:DnaJ domain-containing protein [Ruminococcus sp.]
MIKEAIDCLNKYLILNNKPTLNESYTKNDLKKAYHALSRIYHPDLNRDTKKEKIESIMKEINSAHDTLEKNLERKPKVTTSSKDLRTLKQDYVTKIKSYNSPTNSKDEFYHTIKNEIKAEIDKYVPLIENSYSISQVEEFFEEFDKSIHKIYNKFFYKFCTSECIDFDRISEIINYKQNDYAFYKFLLTIKNKYSGLSKLYSLVESYKNNNYFNYAENSINEALKKAKSKVTDDKKSIDDVAKELEKEIKKIITDYEYIVTKIRALKVLNKFNSHILEKVKQIEEDLNNGESAKIIIKELEDLDRLIAEEEAIYQMKISVNKIYKEVFNKANSVLSKIDPEQLERIESIRRKLDIVSAILKAVYNNDVKIDLKVLEELTKLTFTNDEIDNDIISLITISVRKDKNHTLYVDDNSYSSIYLPLEEKGNIYKMACLYNNEVTITDVSKEMLKSFIPLDNFLTLPNLIWKCYNSDFQASITLLYRLNDFSYLTLKRDCHNGKDTSNLEMMYSPNLSAFNLSPPINIDAFKDPEVIKEKLASQIINALKPTTNRSK